MENKLREITEVKIGFKIKSLKDSKRLSQIIAKENDINIAITRLGDFLVSLKTCKQVNSH